MALSNSMDLSFDEIYIIVRQIDVSLYLFVLCQSIP